MKRPARNTPPQPMSLADQAYMGMAGQTAGAVMNGRVPATDPALRNWDMLNSETDMQPAQGGAPAAPARR